MPVEGLIVALFNIVLPASPSYVKYTSYSYYWFFDTSHAGHLLVTFNTEIIYPGKGND
jgi:hypothetical protein